MVCPPGLTASIYNLKSGQPHLKRQQQLQITHLQREQLRLLSQSSPHRTSSPSQIPGRYPPSSTRKQQYQYQTDPPNPSNELLLRKLPNPVNRVTNRSQSGALVIYLSNQTRLHRSATDDINRNTSFVMPKLRILFILRKQARQPLKPSSIITTVRAGLSTQHQLKTPFNRDLG